jgi:hypothetical protein
LCVYSRVVSHWKITANSKNSNCEEGFCNQFRYTSLHVHDLKLVLQVDSGVKRVEEDKNENKVVLYFDQIPKKERSVI